MAGDRLAELLSLLDELRLSEDYSDLTILVGEERLKVHKAIVCPRSTVLAQACHDIDLKEGQASIIRFPGGDPDLVELMLSYLYLSDYTHLLSKIHLFEFHPVLGFVPPSELPCYGHVHAEMYTLGERYGIGGLKTMAMELFKSVHFDTWTLHHFWRPAEVVYSNASETDRGMRDLVVDLFSLHKSEVLKRPEFQRLLNSYSLLHIDLEERWGRIEVVTISALEETETSGEQTGELLPYILHQEDSV